MGEGRSALDGYGGRRRGALSGLFDIGVVQIVGLFVSLATLVIFVGVLVQLSRLARGMAKPAPIAKTQVRFQPPRTFKKMEKDLGVDVDLLRKYQDGSGEAKTAALIDAGYLRCIVTVEGKEALLRAEEW